MPRLLLATLLCALACSTRAQLPTVEDPGLQVQRITGNLQLPTGIAFLPRSNSAFILEKDSGRVKLLEGNRITGTALRLNAESTSERGLLGIALHPRFTRNGLVYLYHTNADADGNATDNRISAFKYNAETKKLALQRVIKKLPVSPGPNHDGGKIAFGPDGKLYAVIGDLNRNERTQNNANTNTINRQGVVLRLNPKNGSSPTDNPFFSANNTGGRRALNDIYAYGVRNSFGLNFDPETGHLWDTENGQSDYDEINRVRPGMNSGWRSIMGPRSRAGVSLLVNLGRRARYRDPLFSWRDAIGVTDLAFPMNTLGADHRDSILVGDNNNGLLYQLPLNDARSDLDVAALGEGLSSDRVADDGDSQSPIIFGEGWGVTTDIERGPGGLYVLGFDFSGNGYLHRIRPAPAARSTSSLGAASVPEPSTAGAFSLLALAFLRRRPR